MRRHRYLDLPAGQWLLHADVTAALSNFAEPKPLERRHDAVVAFGRDFAQGEASCATADRWILVRSPKRVKANLSPWIWFFAFFAGIRWRGRFASVMLGPISAD